MQTVARTTLPPAGYGAPPNMGIGPVNPMYQNQYRPQMQPFGVQQVWFFFMNLLVRNLHLK